MTDERRGRGRIELDRHEVATLSEAAWTELWRFAEVYTAGSESAFRASVRSKKFVVRLRREGRLVGFGGVDVYALDHEGEQIFVLYTGNLIFEPDVRGQSLVQREGFRIYLETRMAHPRAPIWLFYDTFSYKSYLMLPNNFRAFWPRYDEATPPSITALLERLGQHRYGDDWDAARGICRRGERRLKDGVASIEPAMERHPHIRYFRERNPGYAEGDMLAVLVPLTARNWLTVGLKGLGRTARQLVSKRAI